MGSGQTGRLAQTWGRSDRQTEGGPDWQPAGQVARLRAQIGRLRASQIGRLGADVLAD